MRFLGTLKALLAATIKLFAAPPDFVCKNCCFIHSEGLRRVARLQAGTRHRIARRGAMLLALHFATLSSYQAPTVPSRRALLAGAGAGAILPLSASEASTGGGTSASSEASTGGGKSARIDQTSCFFVAPRANGIGSNLHPVQAHVGLAALLQTSSRTASRAVFIGEHHDRVEDHELQAALITKLNQRRDPNRPLAIGLEAFQIQFQPALDAFTDGQLSLEELRAATEWDKRWSWPFERYVPVFNAAREAGATLLALNVDSEDLAAVQAGGFPALGRERLPRYIQDPVGFANFSKTIAFKEYVEYSIRPSFELHQRLGLLRKDKTGQALEAEIPFRNFLSSRLLSDESMGSRTAAWLRRNPGGLAVSLVGNDHIKFGCGAAARCGRELGGIEHVRTVLVNPRNIETAPKNSFDPGPGLPLTALSLRYSETPGDGGPPIFKAGPQDRQDASSMAQARRGQGALPLSDFLWFSKTLTAGEVTDGLAAVQGAARAPELSVRGVLSLLEPVPADNV